MGGIKFNNFDAIARSFDSNRNGLVEELKVADQVRSKIDTNKDQKIDTKELSVALKSDSIEIKNNEIINSKGIKGNDSQIKNLEKIHNATKSASQWMFPTDFSDLKGQEKIDKLTKNNTKFENSINDMEGTLKDVLDSTKGKEDKTSKFINTVAKNALDDSSKLKLASVANINASKDILGNIVNEKPLEESNNDLRSSFAILNSALEMITKETGNLPDLHKTSKAVDKDISKAFSNIKVINNASKSPDDVKKHLLAVGAYTQLQVTGRAMPYAQNVALVGAAAGGVAGFYLGKSFKAVSIGVATGATLGAAMGALTGKAIDNRYDNKASEIRKLASDVSVYNTDEDIKALDKLAGQAYKEISKLSDNKDLDSAKEANTNLNSIKDKVSEIEDKTSRIVSGYKKAEK